MILAANGGSPCPSECQQTRGRYSASPTQNRTAPRAGGSAEVGFLRRLFGGTERSDQDEGAPIDAAELDASERDHELELLRSEQDRLDDLAQRQLRYAQYSWEPPAQGGERRADDEDKTASK